MVKLGIDRISEFPQLLKGKKRHPTIEDDVTIYSGASILGGETVISEGAVIGGNAFVTKSVPEQTRVSAKMPELQFKRHENVEFQSGEFLNYEILRTAVSSWSSACCRIARGVAMLNRWKPVPPAPNMVPPSSQSFARSTMKRSSSGVLRPSLEKSTHGRYVPSGSIRRSCGILVRKVSRISDRFPSR